ncbi:hypothetical protein GCM10022240_25940 [Microbacterium kribbense]|uniref:Antitoxin Xre/MbcA/ParS-like toxin-binding domain-containing protein n=2 Tax=Microbacterium kribbense TaxID=433645 RepID=A0ABP7GS20_9MICO
MRFPTYTSGMATTVRHDQRPGLRAHEDSIRLPFAELVSQLRDILGVRAVAYIGGVKSSRSVSTWAEGASTPGETDQQRLRNAFYAASLLRESYDATTVQSWFRGMNPALNDQAPAQVLREGDQMKAARDVITAAKSFAHIG